MFLASQTERHQHLVLLGQGLFGFVTNAIQMRTVFPAQTLALAADLLTDGTKHGRSKILAPQKTVTTGGMHLKQVFEFFQNGNVERTAAQVNDDKTAFLFVFLNTVRQCCGGWLIDQSLCLESGKASGVEGGSTLMIVEISGNADDCLVNGLTEVYLGIRLELLEYQRREFLGAELAIAQPDPLTGTHETLELCSRFFRMGNQPVLRSTTNRDHAIIIYADYRGCQQFTQRVGNDDALVVTPNTDQAVCGAQIYPYDGHAPIPSVGFFAASIYRAITAGTDQKWPLANRRFQPGSTTQNTKAARGGLCVAMQT